MIYGIGLLVAYIAFMSYMSYNVRKQNQLIKNVEVDSGFEIEEASDVFHDEENEYLSENKKKIEAIKAKQQNGENDSLPLEQMRLPGQKTLLLEQSKE